MVTTLPGFGVGVRNIGTEKRDIAFCSFLLGEMGYFALCEKIFGVAIAERENARRAKRACLSRRSFKGPLCW